MVSRLKEESLYKHVEDFLMDQLECFDTFQKVGTMYTGFADVIGIKDVGGRTSGDFEVIAVEVKKSTYSFAKNLGQALGYSLLAHRCYLATHLEGLYTAEQEQMADYLGVGLLRIYNRECAEISTSPLHQPINSLMLKMLERKQYALCNICGTLVKAEEGWTKDTKESGKEGKFLYYIKKLPERRVLFSEQEKPTRWVHICSDCMRKMKLGET